MLARKRNFTMTIFTTDYDQPHKLNSVEKRKNIFKAQYASAKIKQEENMNRGELIHMKKRFGIDIDGTVTCPSSMVPFLNEAFNLNITLDDVKQYDLMPLVSVSE
ncbi:hypothetical protein, partial [Enterococcus faecium]|uniref:hypothetical protein n=1 Tax=Enterococcus faecium TaxID=1352 RepID=UPI0030C7FE4F